MSTFRCMSSGQSAWGLALRRAALPVLSVVAVGGVGTAVAVSASAKPKPDLRVTQGSVNRAEAALTGKATFKNAGRAAAKKTTAAVSVRIGARDRREVARFKVEVIKAGGSRTVRFKGSVPAGLPAGTHKLLVCADVKGQIRELSEKNNCRTVGALTVLPQLPPTTPPVVTTPAPPSTPPVPSTPIPPVSTPPATQTTPLATTPLATTPAATTPAATTPVATTPEPTTPAATTPEPTTPTTTTPDATTPAVTTPEVTTPPADGDAPETELVDKPASRSSSAAPRMTYRATERTGAATPGASFECQVDDDAFADCPDDGLTLPTVKHGAHTVRVRASDAAGNTDPTPAEYEFVVDLQAPDTEIGDGAPAALSREAQVDVPYRGTPADDVARIQCSLNGGPFEDCPETARTVDTSADKRYELAVRAIDAFGNVDPTPAVHAWNVDRTAPTTEIESGPEPTVTTRSARVAFTSPDDDVLRYECAVDGGAYEVCAAPALSLINLTDGEHTVSVRAVDEAGNTEADPPTRTWTVDGPDDIDPGVTASGIAEAFPSALRDSIPNDGVDPGVANLSGTAGFPISGGGNGTVGATLVDGASTTDGDVTIGVTPAGRSSATGVVRNSAVVYEEPAGQDALIRPGGDKGLEVISVIPDGQSSTAYNVSIPAGTELRDLPNGTVAVVKTGAEPDPAIADLGDQIEAAENDVVAASIETTADATRAAEQFDDTAAAAKALIAPAAPAVGPAQDPADLRDASGDISPIADPTATNDQVAAAVTDLERGLDRSAIPAEQVAAIDDAEQQLADAKAVLAGVEAAEKLEIEAEASRLLDNEITEVLNDDTIAARQRLVNAHLEIGDAEAEQLRTALEAVDAQRYVDDGQVVGLVSAPMVKDDEGDPLLASLEVSGDKTVTLGVSPDVQGDVVADPFFVPVAIFVARVVIPRVAPVVIRVAAQATKQILSKAGSAATKAGQIAVKTVKVTTQVAKSAAQAAVKVASRVVSQVRGAAAAVVRAAQAAGNAAVRFAAQAREAARIAAQRIQQLQAEGRKVVDDMVRKAADQWKAVVRQRDEIAHEIANNSRKLVTDVAAKARRAGDSARETMAKVQGRLADLLPDRLRAAWNRLPASTREATKEAAGEGIETFLQKVADNWLTGLESCTASAVLWIADMRGSRPVGDAAKTIDKLYTNYDLVDCALGAVDDGWNAVLTRDELRDVIAQELVDADREGAATLAKFPPPPPAVVERKVSVIGQVVPGSVAAGRLGFIQITGFNEGRALPLDSTHLYVPGGMPWVHAGNVPGDGSRIVLTDENADGVWSYHEVVTAVIEVNPPVMRSRGVGVSYGFISEGAEFSGGHSFGFNVDGPRETITAFNKVTNGPTQIREDPVPVRLTTQPWTRCTSRGCNINGTERGTDQTYDHAVCVTTGDRITNGEDNNARDDGNPWLYSSNQYYGVQLGGTFGYVSFVWINPGQRDGRGLPGC